MQGTIHELENQLSQTVAGSGLAQAEHGEPCARGDAAAVSRHSALQAENARSRTESERALEEIWQCSRACVRGGRGSVSPAHRAAQVEGEKS